METPFFSKRAWSLVAVCSLLLATGSNAADGEYRLATGDVIEISIAGVTGLGQHSTIDLNGKITFPLLGSVTAAGLTLEELQSSVRREIPEKMLRQRSPDGRESLVTISPHEVVLNVREYRPVYLSGDIAKPGEVAFRPGLTVRQAISLGGGIGAGRSASDNVLSRASDYRSEQKALTGELAVEKARIARLEAELHSSAASIQASLSELRLSPGIATKISELEMEQLNMRREAVERERDYRTRAGERIADRSSILKKQREQEEEGLRLDTSDWERVRDLFNTGKVPVTRLLDSRRSLLLSSTRTLQTEAEVIQMERDQEENRRILEKIDHDRRLELLSELQQANARATKLSAQLTAAREKLTLLGFAPLAVSGEEPSVHIKIFRQSPSGEEVVEASESSTVLPGDVIQLTMPAFLDATSSPER